MKYMLLSIFALVAVLAAAVSIYQSAAAQTDDGVLAPIYEDTQPGDEDLIASVGTVSLKRQQLRQAVEYQVAVNSDPMAGEEFREQAEEIAITTIVNEAIEYARATELGFAVTDAEVEEFMAPFKAACAGPQGGDCQEVIRLLGVSFDEYWEQSFDENKKLMVRMKMKTAHVDGLYPNGWTHEQRNEAMTAFEEKLRNDATVQWEDQEMRQTYEGATSDSGSTGSVFD